MSCQNKVLKFGVGLMVASKSSLEAAETFNEKVYVIHRTGPHRVKRARHHTPPYTPHRATQLDAVYAELFTEGVEPEDDSRLGPAPLSKCPTLRQDGNFGMPAYIDEVSVQ